MHADPDVRHRAVTFDANYLAPDQGHRVYYEQSGTANGIAVLVLHGGPGSGSSPHHREFFDADKFRIVQFDQRGCGRSEPAGAIAHNHSDALIGDIERLRQQLQIERWLVFGGSWGSSLALAYAARHADRVSGLIVRGIFLTGQADLDWYFHAVAAVLPEAHTRFIEQIPRKWRRNIPTYLDRVFQSGDALKKSRIALAWQSYEAALNGKMDRSDTASSSETAIAAARDRYTIQAHYLARRCFLGETSMLRAAASLRGIPIAIVHGSVDFVCRPSNAWRLHRSCVGSQLRWAIGASHDPFHPATAHLLRKAAEAFSAHGDFSQWCSASA